MENKNDYKIVDELDLFKSLSKEELKSYIDAIEYNENLYDKIDNN